jgi:hypothetical protein
VERDRVEGKIWVHCSLLRRLVLIRTSELNIAFLGMRSEADNLDGLSRLE